MTNPAMEKEFPITVIRRTDLCEYLEISEAVALTVTDQEMQNIAHQMWERTDDKSIDTYGDLLLEAVMAIRPDLFDEAGGYICAICGGEGGQHTDHCPRQMD